MRPGEITTVYYRPPGTKCARGAIGFTPQRTPSSGWWLVGFMMVMIVLIWLPLPMLNH